MPTATTTDHEHLWMTDSDDEGRIFEVCVKPACGTKKVSGTTATRW